MLLHKRSRVCVLGRSTTISPVLSIGYEAFLNQHKDIRVFGMRAENLQSAAKLSVSADDPVFCPL
jgi:hypothetical protein